MGDRMLDAESVSKRLNVGRAKVYALIALGELEAVDVAMPNSKRPVWRIPESVLLAFMAKRTRGPLVMQTR